MLLLIHLNAMTFIFWYSYSAKYFLAVEELILFSWIFTIIMWLLRKVHFFHFLFFSSSLLFGFQQWMDCYIWWYPIMHIGSFFTLFHSFFFFFSFLFFFFLFFWMENFKCIVFTSSLNLLLGWVRYWSFLLNSSI